MRLFVPALTMILLSGAALLLLIPLGMADSPWVIDDHVVMEEQDTTFDRNVTIADGGWLEVVGSSLRFNCSHSLEYIIKVDMGGRLTVRPSQSGRGCDMGPTDARYPTRIVAAWSDAVSIEGLTMSDCGDGVLPAIQIDNVDGPVVRDCAFRYCGMAISIRTCTNIFMDGNRVNDSLGGVQIWSAQNCQVENNRIEECRAGIEIQFSTNLVVRGNVVSVLDGGGLTLYSVDNALVQSNSIETEIFSPIEVSMCKLLTIEDQRMKGTPSDIYDMCGIFIKTSSFVRVQNCTLINYIEGVKILSWFGDRKESNILSSIDIRGCEIGVNISSVANIVIGCTIEGCRVGIRIGPNMVGDPSVDNLVDGCSFNDCPTGILDYSSRMQKIERTAFIGCDVAISGKDISGDIAANCTISDFRTTAVSMSNGELEIRNCTIGNGPIGVSLRSQSAVVVQQSTFQTVDVTALLDGRSTLELHNSSHVRVYNISMDSEVTIYWDVEVTVKLTSGERMIISGSLHVRDVDDWIVSNSHVPLVPSVICVEVLGSRHRGDDVDLRTPHRFKFTFQDKSGAMEAAVTEFVRIVIQIDDVPPQIWLQSPLYNVSTDLQVHLKGCCTDDCDENVSIEVFVDGGLLFSGESVWDLVTDMEDGSHELEYIATDASGNELRISRRMFVDSIPPILEILSPPTNPFLIADDELTISGSVEDGVGVSLDGVELSLKAGTFSSTLYLPKDDTYSVEVVAWDGLHNARSLVLTVIRDMTPPLLLLDESPSITADTPLVVGGGTDPSGSRVSLAGEDVPLLPGGRFTLILDLDEGSNKIAIMAVDEAGNTVGTEIEVTLDTEAVFEIVWPTNGTVVQWSEIVVLVHGELGAQYRIEPLGWVDADENGYCSLPLVLYEPTNQVVVSARDRVGNLHEQSVTVSYTPRAISHETALPFMAWMIILTVILGTLALSILYLRTRRRT